ncbi:MAG TPA: immunoglobulin-like domain-containing protein [Mobilitalea sp.]|nr:immunoglobulin-like domain-containing protein [Mobilitalea sp.]
MPRRGYNLTKEKITKLIWVAIGALFSIFLVCSKEEIKVNKDDYPLSIGEENKLVFNTETGLILTLKEGTLTPTGATYIVKNEGADVVYFGMKYFLQILLDEKWFNIEGNPFWTLELIHLNPGEEIELLADWSNFFGVLPPGNYRFVKEFHLSEFPSGKIIYLNSPFTINKNQ